MNNGMLAAIRIRGVTQLNAGINDTMKMLRLYRKNYCVILPNNVATVGMLKKAKDYITWGEINEETQKSMVEKRGEKDPAAEGKSIKKYFRLNAPKKGYGRKGIKHTFSNGGALGYRGAAINELIKRML